VSTGPATAAHPAAPAGFQVRDDEELGYAASTAHGTLAYDDEMAGGCSELSTGGVAPSAVLTSIAG
jgi:hypothetical protein